MGKELALCHFLNEARTSLAAATQNLVTTWRTCFRLLIFGKFEEMYSCHDVAKIKCDF
jgi:hypothetical protein